MKSTSIIHNPGIRVPLAGILGWLLPGAGHLFIGERARGLIFLIVIALTFWTGIAIGGVKHTVDKDARFLWFLGQICAGGHTLAAMTWSSMIDAPEEVDRVELTAYGRSEEVSVVYTAICGMLNILIIFDVLTRAEQGLEVDPQRGPPGKAKGVSA